MLSGGFQNWSLADPLEVSLRRSFLRKANRIAQEGTPVLHVLNVMS